MKHLLLLKQTFLALLCVGAVDQLSVSDSLDSDTINASASYKDLFLAPQGPVLHFPAAPVPAECVPAGPDAAGEMEAQVAHHYR